ncbi:MAG: hypothetical protein ACRD59_03305 [Candidatus Acidiferrales bacterium]
MNVLRGTFSDQTMCERLSDIMDGTGLRVFCPEDDGTDEANAPHASGNRGGGTHALVLLLRLLLPGLFLRFLFHKSPLFLRRGAGGIGPARAPLVLSVPKHGR